MAVNNIEDTQINLRKTTKQSLFSLSFDLGGIFAGLFIFAFIELLSVKPWMLALYPGILSMRGVVGGFLSGRLTTALHLGTIKGVGFGEENNGLLSLWGSTATLALVSSLFLGLTTTLFGIFLWQTTILDWATILSTVVATMGLSLLLISPITIAIAFLAYRKGLDPDIIVYPIISTIADILTTLCYVCILGLAVSTSISGSLLIMTICVGFICTVSITVFRNLGESSFKRTMKEAFYTLAIVAIIVNVTGAILSRIQNQIGYRTGIYVIYPALINTIGDVGAVVGSTTTTKLALGTLETKFRSLKNHSNQILGVWGASLMVFLVLSFISTLYERAGILPLLRNTLLVTFTNIFSVAVMVYLVFTIAVSTFRRGLDPDNFVIPIESSLADTITTFFLLLGASLIGL
jgi:mgtE-like transporter